MFKGLIDRLRGNADPGADVRGEGDLLDAYVTQARAASDFWIAKFQGLPAAKAIAAAAPEVRLRVVGLALQRLGDLRYALARKRRDVSFNDPDHQAAHALKELVSNLLRARLPFDEQSLATLLSEMAFESRWAPLSAAAVVRAAEFYAEDRALSDEHRERLRKLKTYLGGNYADQRRIGQRIEALLAAKDGAAVARGLVLVAGDPWSDAMADAMASADGPIRAAWQRLINHAVTARGSKPSAKWTKTAATLIEGIGRDRFVAGVAAWLPLVGKPGLGNPMRGYTRPHPEPTVLNEHNADVLKGLVWAGAATGDDPVIARLLGDVAEVCFKKIPTHGARCPKVANACLAALSLMTGPEPVAQLSRIRAKAKKPSAQKLIDKALAASAEKQGVSPEELEEMAVPDFGLDPAGRRAIAVGEWTAEVALTPARDVELRWRKGTSGKAQASVPADVKRDHADALKDLKRLVKDIERVLATQVARIERLLLDDRSWPLDVWRTRYLDHPLIGPFARRLIWQIDTDPTRTFIHHGQAFVDALDQPLTVPTSAQLRLWHPIRSAPDAVLAWRRWLEAHAVTQPFKQAHREIYLLTDAERQTQTYSNRFAGHILRQHQFHALCGARGWSYHLQGAFDSYDVPTRILRRQGMRVEFWVDGGAGGAAQTSDAGIFLHVSTDQVRFYGGESEQDPMPLDRVPPHVLSELMRDVDLFVGVCSVGNDPTWRDRGEQFGDYWQGYTFGELGESAKTRRDVLSRLLPRLKIADRATLTERFLVVRGDLRTYKIHLGSGNIQMEPNNQYLCIVPDRRTKADDVFLPFEGDQTLAVILSKAFMLAGDTRIKDGSIVSQIRGR